MPPGEYCDGASEHGNALEGLPAAGEGRECQMSDEVKVTTQVSSPGARVREPPDGGYGWVIVFATVMLGITIGAKYVSFGVFLLEFSEFLDLPQADISLLASIDMIAFTVVSKCVWKCTACMYIYIVCLNEDFAVVCTSVYIVLLWFTLKSNHIYVLKKDTR